MARRKSSAGGTAKKPSSPAPTRSTVGSRGIRTSGTTPVNARARSAQALDALRQEVLATIRMAQAAEASEREPAVATSTSADDPEASPPETTGASPRSTRRSRGGAAGGRGLPSGPVALPPASTGRSPGDREPQPAAVAAAKPTMLRLLADEAERAGTPEELALVGRLTRRVAGARSAGLTAADREAAATSIGAFFEAVGDGVISAQRALDQESERYSAGGAPGGITSPTSYRIPRVEAEIRFAMEKSETRGFDIFIAKSKSSSDLLVENRVRFEVVAAPPPPDVAARLARTRPLLDQLVLDPRERDALIAGFRAAAASGGSASQAVQRILGPAPVDGAVDAAPDVLLVRQSRPGGPGAEAVESVTAIKVIGSASSAPLDPRIDLVRMLLPALERGSSPRLDEVEHTTSQTTWTQLRTLAVALFELATWQRSLFEATSARPRPVE